jgi:transcription initiation factor TFIIB
MNEYTDDFDTESFITRCLKELELNAVVGRKAKEILKRAAEVGIPSGQNPAGQASAAIYIAAILTKNRVTQSSLAEVTGVSEGTIRKRYIELTKGLGYYSGSS